MEGNTVTRFRWFWAWQDEEEEQWLERMSRKGYHLSSVGVPGFYTFAVTEPRDYVYRLDYQTFRRRDRREYVQLFCDAGWEHVGEMSAWQYFRKETNPGATPEIYTDAQSRKAKYRRVLAYLGFMWVMLATVSAGRLLVGSPYRWWGAINVILAVVLLLLSYAIIRTAIRVRQLRKL